MSFSEFAAYRIKRGRETIHCAGGVVEQMLKIERTAPGIMELCSSAISVWTGLITYRPRMFKIYFIFNHIKVTTGRQQVDRVK